MAKEDDNKKCEAAIGGEINMEERENQKEVKDEVQIILDEEDDDVAIIVSKS